MDEVKKSDLGGLQASRHAPENQGEENQSASEDESEESMDDEELKPSLGKELAILSAGVLERYMRRADSGEGQPKWKEAIWEIGGSLDQYQEDSMAVQEMGIVRYEWGFWKDRFIDKREGVVFRLGKEESTYGGLDGECRGS